jgi:hypothetical protein
MKEYIICYELCEDQEKYNSMCVINVLQELGEYQYVTRFNHLLKCKLSAKEIYEKLHPVISSDDKLLVVEINSENIDGYISSSVWNFLRILTHRIHKIYKEVGDGK